MRCSSVIRLFYRNDKTTKGKWLPFPIYSEEKVFVSRKIRGLSVWNFSSLIHESARWKSSDVSSWSSSFALCNQMRLEEPVLYEKCAISCTLCEENLISLHTNTALLSINTYRKTPRSTVPLNQFIEGFSNQFLGRGNNFNTIYQKNYRKSSPLLDASFGSWLTNNLPLHACQKRSITCSTTHFKTEADAAASTQVIDWKLASKSKLLDAQHKIDDAKAKLGDATQNRINEIYVARARMKEKMGKIIERENIFTIPNLLCVFRIVAAPYLCHLVLISNYQFALGLFLLAGVTDLADGWIARMFPSQASKLGSFLDPLADKVLVAMLFLALTYNGMIPAALTALIIYRDVAIIAAASYLRYRSLPAPRTILRYFDATHATVQLAPTGISKLNTVMQLTLITAALATPVLGVPSPELTMALWSMTTVTTFASGLSYIFSNNTYKMLGELKEQVEQQQRETAEEEQQQRETDEEEQQR